MLESTLDEFQPNPTEQCISSGAAWRTSHNFSTCSTKLGRPSQQPVVPPQRAVAERSHTLTALLGPPRSRQPCHHATSLVLLSSSQQNSFFERTRTLSARHSHTCSHLRLTAIKRQLLAEPQLAHRRRETLRQTTALIYHRPRCEPPVQNDKGAGTSLPATNFWRGRLAKKMSAGCVPASSARCFCV